jgi:putative tryptophan/tyrosine transport system substrate-binding protein
MMDIRIHQPECSGRVSATLFALNLLGALLFTFCFSAEGRESQKIPRIGVIVNGSISSDASRIEAFRQGLRDLGYVEGQNIAIDYRYGEGKIEEFPGMVTELLGLKADVIMVGGTPAALAAQKASKTIPVVFATVADPLSVKLVSSLGHPGGNITGITTINSELTPKRLEIIREAVGRLSRVAFLYNPADASNIVSLRELRALADRLKLTLDSVGVRNGAEFDRAFSVMAAKGTDALVVSAGALTDTYRKQIVVLSAKTRMPAMYGEKVFVEAGGLMSYAANFSESWRRGATYVDKILKGAKPADLPVEQPRKFELVINVKAAKQIGLRIPQSLVFSADEVIK